MYNEQYRNPVAVLTSKKTNLPIRNLPAKFGRNDSAVDVYFFHESISREHCLFECINHAFTVRDLGSTVGTYINGVKLEQNVPYNLEDGVKLTLGKVRFTFHANYEELEAREHAHSPKPLPIQQSSINSGGTLNNRSNSPAIQTGSDGRKTVTVSAKELNEFEYDENEVQYIECGLKPETTPISYTSKLRKADLERAMLSEEAERIRQDIEEEDSAVIAGNESIEPIINNSDDLKQTQQLDADTFNAGESQRSADSIAPVKNAAEVIQTKTPKHYLVLSWMDDEIGENKKIKIGSFPFSIGRKSDENNYAIMRKGISRRHMHFEEQEGSYYLIDDNSTNGVRLNGNKIVSGERNLINEGDSIRIADVTFTVAVQ